MSSRSRRRSRNRSRLPHWQELAVYCSLAALALTGLAWLSMDWWVRVEGEFGPEHAPAQAWLLVAHGAVAYLFLIVAGAMIPVHIRAGLATRRNLISGLTLSAALTLLTVTALALYYVGAEALRAWSSLAHWLIGIFVIPALIVHAVMGKQRRQMSDVATRAPARLGEG